MLFLFKSLTFERLIFTKKNIMKKAVHLFALMALIISLSVSSCVSLGRYITSENKVNKLQKENDNSQTQLQDCNVRVKNLGEDKASLQSEYLLIQNDLKELNSESKMTIADQAKRLKSLQDMIQSQRDGMAILKNSITDALLNYQTDELSVSIRDGKVYVSLEEKLLFKSGSDVVDIKGKEALKTLAKVLKNAKDITVMVEGHTDNLPIKTKQFEDNWDLSTARATSILRVLTKDNGFDSNRITASGKGQFHPIKTNETVAGRAANRRSEIILSPDLKEIYKLLLI
jgi:chemotaxis protein MotB